MRFITKTQTLISTLFTAMFVGLMGSAFASPSIEDLWTAFDISTINGKVLAILTTFVTINLGFLAYRYIKKTMSRG
ncbi:MAG: hypothetical protein V6Z89_15235 [Desulfobacter sp.]